MCGIGGLLLSPDDLQRVSVDDMLKTLALEIESRGKDATGVGRLTQSNRFRVSKAPSKASTFFDKHPQIGADCRLAIVHTRAWTKGDAKRNENNHPITSGPITLIHNGVVGNDDAVFAKYKWNRTGEVDSEVIATAIHHLGWKDALELLEGSIACAWHDMAAPGHLFVARHTSSPLHIGITESGSIIFASTNTAVAKAAVLLGGNITIDSIKEGVMCEFWIGLDGKLESNIEQFDPPKPVWSRQGSWQYEGGAWFPADNRSVVTTFPNRPRFPNGPQGAAAGTATEGKDWVLGMDGWVIKTGAPVVFVPIDPKRDVTVGKLTFIGGRLNHVYVEVTFDHGVTDEIQFPTKQLLPYSEWLDRWERPTAQQPLALPAAPAEPDDDEDFYCPRSTTALVAAIEDIFGADALQLMPGFIEWDRGEYPEMELIDDGYADVIDVEEVLD